MKVKLEIDDKYIEPNAIIYTNKVTDEISKIVDFIKEEKELIEAANKVYEKSLLEDINFNKGLSKEDWKNRFIDNITNS